MVIKRTDAAPGWINRRFADLERQIRELRAAKGLRAATIGDGGLTIKDGGSLVIKDGGEVRVKHRSEDGGDDAVLAGDIFDGPTGPYQGTGLLVEQADGTDILNVRSDITNGVNVRLGDRNGDPLIEADVEGGLSSPWLATGLTPARFSDWPKSTSATYETLWDGYMVKHHPYLFAQIRHTSDDPATSGDVRVLADGVVMGTTSAIAFAISSHVVTAALSGSIKHSVYIEVQARRTAGAGNVMCRPRMLIGMEST